MKRSLAYLAVIIAVVGASLVAALHTPTSYAANPYAVGGVLKPAKVAPSGGSTGLIVGLTAVAAVAIGALVARKVSK